MPNSRFHLILLAAVTAFATTGFADDRPIAPAPAVENDYPTDARADYVFACMSTNGGTQETLRKCSCAIDVIASIIPYAAYEKADTVLRMRRNTSGYLAQTFRVQIANEIVRSLEEAQAEADVRCF